MDTCYKTGDNKYRDCPPRMSDGRHFTDYRPECSVNSLIKQDNDLTNNNNLRIFLQENGAELIEKNREYACSMNCCGPCDEVEGFESTMLPEAVIQKTDITGAEFVKGNNRGLGLGRDYGVSGICNDRPDSGTFNETKPNNCVSVEDAFSYLGDTTKTGLGRHTSPRGGTLKVSGWDPLSSRNMAFNP